MVLALVALDLDGIEYVGTGFEHHSKLELSGGRIDGRLRRWKSVRTGAQ